MESTDHSIGHFAVLTETATKNEWLFYKAHHPTRARQLAMMRQETVRVCRIIMITKSQYETGVHNLKILEAKKMAKPKLECASRGEFNRRKNREVEKRRREKRKQTA